MSTTPIINSGPILLILTMAAGLRFHNGSTSWCTVPVWQVSECDVVILLLQELVYFSLTLMMSMLNKVEFVHINKFCNWFLKCNSWFTIICAALDVLIQSCMP